MTYDLLIIGGGPAGVAAGVYAARKQLKTLLITSEWGGQSIVSAEIQNWIGTIAISGPELAQNLQSHLEAYKGEFVDILSETKVTSVKKQGVNFIVTTDKGTTFEVANILVTVGSTRRKLLIPGADTFEHKGLTYCASCDGPMFSGSDIVVIGGGNAAFESASQLLAYAKSVTILQRGPEFRADEITVKKVLEHPNVKAYTNTELVEIKGDTFVSSLVYTDVSANETHDLKVTGIFVEIGLIPSTDFIGELVKKNTNGQIIVDPRTQRTSTVGVWAAGDCTDGLYHQNNIAVGDAVKALEDIYLAIHAK